MGIIIHVFILLAVFKQIVVDVQFPHSLLSRFAFLSSEVSGRHLRQSSQYLCFFFLGLGFPDNPLKTKQGTLVIPTLLLGLDVVSIAFRPYTPGRLCRVWGFRLRGFGHRA